MAFATSSWSLDLYRWPKWWAQSMHQMKCNHFYCFHELFFNSSWISFSATWLEIFNLLMVHHWMLFQLLVVMGVKFIEGVMWHWGLAAHLSLRWDSLCHPILRVYWRINLTLPASWELLLYLRNFWTTVCSAYRCTNATPRTLLQTLAIKSLPKKASLKMSLFVKVNGNKKKKKNRHTSIIIFMYVVYSIIN